MLGPILFIVAVAVATAVYILIAGLCKAAAKGDRQLVQAAEDRRVNGARIFSDPHRFDLDHGAGR